MNKLYTISILHIISCAKAMKNIGITILLCCLAVEGYSTAWTTATPGLLTTLSNWTNGTIPPTTFTTPGDTWTVTMPMTMSSGVAWIVGTTGMAPATVTIATGGPVHGSGGGFVLSMTIYGNINIADSIVANGGGCQILMNIFGNLNITTGSVTANGGSSMVKMKVNGNLMMTGGSIAANGGSAIDSVNVNGNFSMSGPSYISGNGGSATSTVLLSLPAGSGTMMIDNTSTGTWIGTNVYVVTGCTAQLDGNFKTTTGGATYGLTVNGTLICPSADTVNGIDMFKLNGGATLEVAHASGINGAIATTGTKTFAPGANYVFNGTVAQVTGSFLPAALVSPDTITINNSAGVTLTQSTLTTGTLLFTSGILNTGAFTMSVPGAATAVAGAGATSYVNGTLIKTITGLTTVNYETGDLDYAPMLLTLSTAGTAGSLGVKTTNGLHPSVGTSGLSSANMANHYWTITNTGAAGPATVIPKATYNLADIIGGSNSSFKTQEYTGGAWLGAALATTNTSSPYTSAPNSGITLATLAGAYIFGNVFCGTLPITGSTSVCTGATITLSDATPAGTWNSSTPSVATISGTGLVTALSAGVTTISYTVGACMVTTIVTVNPLPNAGVITWVDTVVCVGHTIVLADTATGGTWVSNNVSLATVSGTGTVTGVAPGIDTITYTVTNSCGTATVKRRIKVLSVATCHTGVVELSQATTTELSVFPNPNSGAFSVNLVSAAADEAVTVVITNVFGEKIKEFTATTNKVTELTIDAAPGIYIVSAATANGRYNAKVLVK